VRSSRAALRNRLLPALLTATGVSLIAGGLLTYSSGVDGPSPNPSPITFTAPPTASSPPTFPSISGSASPSAAAVDRVATRVRIPLLKIDLPVIKPKGGPTAYPQCNVAMYIEDPRLHQPGQGGATYLYAHARPGMFEPIYLRATLGESGGPESMIDMPVFVYTSDDQLFTYVVQEVLLHQLTLTRAQQATTEELWLQTSEGPKNTPGKTQLLATFLDVVPVDHAAAHPIPKPVDCE
jgi:hypothetical protein